MKRLPFVSKAKIMRRYSSITYLAMGLGLLAAIIGQSAAPNRRQNRPRDRLAFR